MIELKKVKKEPTDDAAPQIEEAGPTPAETASVDDSDASEVEVLVRESVHLMATAKYNKHIQELETEVEALEEFKAKRMKSFREPASPPALSPTAETFSPRPALPAPPPPSAKSSSFAARLTLASLKKNTAPTPRTAPTKSAESTYEYLRLNKPRAPQRRTPDHEAEDVSFAADPDLLAVIGGLWDVGEGPGFAIEQIARVLRDIGTTTTDGEFTDCVRTAKWIKWGLAVKFKRPDDRDGFVRIVGERLRDRAYNNLFHEIRFRGQLISVRKWENHTVYQDRFRTGRGGGGKNRGRGGFGGQY